MVENNITWEARPWLEYWLVLEEAPKSKGHQLEDRFQNKDEGEDVVADLQRVVKLL